VVRILHDPAGSGSSHLLEYRSCWVVRILHDPAGSGSSHLLEYRSCRVGSVMPIVLSAEPSCPERSRC